MPYFVDTSFFVALFNADDDNHSRAEEIFVEIGNGKYGKLKASDYVLDEAVTVARKRTRRHDIAVRVAEMISNSVWIDMVYVIKDEVIKALKEYRRYQDKELSFTDWVSVLQIRSRGWQGIISFDEDFDKVGMTRIA